MTRPGEIDATGEAYRPLVSRAGLLGLAAAVVVVLAMLLPTAVRRQSLALEILPDALSLIYLDLNLARRPFDAELRLQVARKTLEAGQFAAARSTLDPLLTPGSPVFERASALKLTEPAEALRLEIDRKAWAAIPPEEVEARATELARVIADVDALDLSRAPAERVQKIADLCQSLAKPERAAALLDGLARRQLPEFEAHVAAAETAHLQADTAERAVELQMFAAEQTAGAVRIQHVLRALELARGVMKPEAQLEFAEEARRRFGPRDPQLMAASLDLAQVVDIKLAYQLAQRLVQSRPDDAVLHRRLAKLAEWNGVSLKALDEYVWLVRHEGRAADRARAIELAKANWDLPLLRKLLAGPRGTDESAADAAADAGKTAKPAAKPSSTAKVRRPAPVRAERARKRAELAPQASRWPSRAAVSRHGWLFGTRARCGEPGARRVRSGSEAAIGSLAANESARSRSVSATAASTQAGSQPSTAPGVQRAAVSASSARRVERLRAQLRETLSLLEALGDTRAAIAAVDVALRGPLGSDAATWETKVALLQRTGDAARAADAQSELAARFPSQARSIALADMRLALAQPRAALSALMSAPGARDETFLRQILDVAWELGDLPACENTARELVALPNASAWDVARLYQLQRANPDPRVALATAVAGFDRYKNAEMLRLVIEAASHANDDTQVAKLLTEAERFGSFRADPGYWQQRITLHQRLAFAAFEQREFLAAKRELGESDKALSQAAELAPSGNDIYDLLRTSQNAQALAVALESGDKPALADVFAKYGTELPVRQQVYVLHRLGRDDEAYALARKGASDPRLSDDDRAALRADQPPSTAPSGTERTDYARASSEFFDSEGLRLWTNQADVAVGGEDFGVRGAAALTEITPQQTLRSLQPMAAREVQGELGGRAVASEASVGLRVREGDVARPFGVFKQGILGERGSLLSASASINGLTFDSAQLRLAGATDEVALQSSIPLGLGYYVSARAAGNRYLTLERDYLGSGVSVDSGVGRSFNLPGDFARAALRIAGRFAPRFRDADSEAKQDARQPESWIPRSTTFAGVGASLARGELELPNARDPYFRFLLDGAIGVLWPTQKLGWSGQVGVGSRLFGNDQLSAALQTGNVVGAVAYWSVQAGYAVGLE